MNLFNLLKYAHLAYLSKPAERRPVFRSLRGVDTRSIVQLGMGDVCLASQLIWLAQQGVEQRVRFTGVDLFEMRTVGDRLTLKECHKKLTATGARVKLVPGDPFAALARTANSLSETDLLIISADQDPAAMAQAWFYVPRMLHEGSQVWQETGEGQDARYERLNIEEINRRSVTGQNSMRRAA